LGIFLLIWAILFCPSSNAATLTYYRYHIVQKGDSLWEISKQYGVSIKEIKEKNSIRGSRIYPRQKLIIPIKVKGVYHEVKRHETLWRICKTYGVDMEEVIYLNQLSDPDHLVAGQKIFIPGASKVKKVEIPEKVIAPPKEEVPSQGDIIQPPPSKDIGETVRGKGFLIWPIKGDIKGYRKSGFGIDIFAPEETAIVAPAKGKVYFSGWLRNYGRTIIIEHKELGLYTCYMHNSVNLVEKDDLVEQGEPIAKIGSTGTAEDILLHFEVRRAKDGKPMDPFEYLPSDFK